MIKGSIDFKCSDKELTDGFRWAKKQALAYSHEGDLAGNWYEAALPGRNAFCIRDVCHHITGAHYLGLDSHSKNMLLKFAQSISDSRDFCSFWEITKDYAPATVDYKSDDEFWYNLPANFDIADACLRAYRLTGDKDFVNGYDFIRFYSITSNEYIERWDHDRDGIPDRTVFGNFRGIPSYDEQKGMEEAAVAADLIAAEIRGLFSCSKLAQLRGDDGSRALKRAEKISEILNSQWWDEKNGSFYGARLKSGEFVSELGSPHLLLYFNSVTGKEKKKMLLNKIHLDSLNGVIVELLSHYPEIFYKNGDKEKGLYWLKKCISPNLLRREYPEVSFAAVGTYIECLMGIFPNAEDFSVKTVHNLPESITEASITGCPLFGGSIDYCYSDGIYRLINNTGKEIKWNGIKIKNGLDYSYNQKELLSAEEAYNV